MTSKSPFTSGLAIATFLTATLSSLSAAAQQDSLTPYNSPDEVPQNAIDLWKDYDPRKEDLEVKVHHEWKKDGVVSRLITFKVGTFKGADSRIAAYYCFPDNGKKNPAFVWSHGGGQRADRNRGHYFATQGFATVDINWLGRPLEAELDAENKWGTDWGKIDPTQGPNFYAKALRKQYKSNFQPDEHSVDPIVSPRNSNWFMLSLAGRRALTFLEQQAEVDANKLGFSGFSMGGTITSMTAIDKRLKAVAPFVGGTANLWQNYPGMKSGGVIRIKDIELYKNTIDPGAYWKHVNIPVMFITSSNDFHSTLDRIYQSMDLLPHDNWRVTGNMHANHGPGPEQWIMLNQWFKQYLAGEEQHIPLTPPSSFNIEGSTAHFTVTPAQQERLKEVEIYYSYHPNPITRFWKKASADKDGNTWKAEIPVHAQLPLFTFALCRYQLPAEQTLERGSTSTFSLNSREHMHIPADIDLAAFEQLPKSGLIDDFSGGMQNWSSRNQRSFTTYKFQDPELDTSGESKLAITLNLTEGREILLGLGIDSKFNGHGKDLGNFHYGTKISGNGSKTILLEAKDFKSKENKALEWSKISTFNITLTDAGTKQPINLASPEGRAILKLIELVKP
ncbi:MAG: alpha/beta hydrolase family protein [Akkermansiaceae bacterium]